MYQEPKEIYKIWTKHATNSFYKKMCKKHFKKVYKKCRENVHKIYKKCTRNIKEVYIKDKAYIKFTRSEQNCTKSIPKFSKSRQTEFKIV